MKYEGEGWEIHVGDFRDFVWPDVDHVMTDPPYSEHVTSNSKTNSRIGGSPDLRFGYNAGDLDLAHEFAAKVSVHCERWCVFTIDDRSMHEWRQTLELHGTRHVRTGFFRRTNPMPQISGDRPGSAGDFVQISHGPGKMRWNAGGQSAHWRGSGPRPGERIRKGQKPVSLLLSWLLQFTDRGDLVCDPFAGSGTTAVAAVESGRRFIGFEMDPVIAGKAAKRIQRHARQLRIMFPESSKAEKARQELLWL